MIEKNPIYALPQTIDQAAEALLNDLDGNAQAVFRGQNINVFGAVFYEVCVALTDEFRIWDGNDSLLNSCMTYLAKYDRIDPAEAILIRAYEMLNEIDIDENGIVEIL